MNDATLTRAATEHGWPCLSQNTHSGRAQANARLPAFEADMQDGDAAPSKAGPKRRKALGEAAAPRVKL